MNKIEKDLLIDSYLSNELDEESLNKFNYLLSVDLEFADQVQFEKEIHNALSDPNKLILRDSLNKIHKVQKSSHKRILYRIRTESIAAVIVTMLVIGAGISGLFNFGTTNQTLYNNYFSPDLNKVVVRSAGSIVLSDIDKGIDLFNENNFEIAISYFEKAGDNPEAILYSGICYMKTSKFNYAIDKFSALIMDKDNIFVDQAEWNLALCYLVTDNTTLAEEMFKEIITSESVYKEKAQVILNELNE